MKVVCTALITITCRVERLYFGHLGSKEVSCLYGYKVVLISEVNLYKDSVWVLWDSTK